MRKNVIRKIQPSANIPGQCNPATHDPEAALLCTWIFRPI
jgi:hypothetical protein